MWVFNKFKLAFENDARYLIVLKLKLFNYLLTTPLLRLFTFSFSMEKHARRHLAFPAMHSNTLLSSFLFSFVFLFVLFSELLGMINDARGASLTCGHLGGVVCCRCNQFVFDVRAFGCSGIVADMTKSAIAS